MTAVRPTPVSPPQRVRLADGWLTYHVAGEGRPVVLVHGLAGSTRWWGRNVGPLAECCRVYTVDLIGFGGSRSGRRFVLDEAATVLAEWMDHLGLPCATFVGHSMGGLVVTHLALQHPERVERLVLVDAAAFPIALRPLARLPSLVLALRHLPLSLLPTIIADTLRAGLRTLWTALAALRRHTLERELAKVQAPTLVVWGERDTVVPLDNGRRLAATLPDARLVTLPGVGHNAMWEGAADFNRVVLDFLEKD